MKMVEERKKKGSAHKRSQYRTRLVSRDYELIEFLLDQQFASISQIHEKFFMKTRNQTESKSQKWVRYRVRALINLGLIRAQRVYSESENFYLCTETGRRSLQALDPSKEYSPVTHAIDYRSFYHELMLNQFRIRFEESGRPIRWISEKKISVLFPEKAKLLGRQFIPDAMFEDEKGELVALEYELTKKSVDRYRAKIDRYVETMLDMDGMFKKTLYVSSQESTRETLARLTESYQDLFEVKTQKVILENRGQL